MKNRERINSISIVLVIILIVIVLASNSNKTNNDTQYYRSAEVTDIKGTMCYLEDTEGNVWCYENENLQMYGRYILIMNDNNTTEDITDDIIMSIE